MSRSSAPRAARLLRGERAAAAAAATKVQPRHRRKVPFLRSSLARCMRTQRTPERGERMMMQLLTRHSGQGTLEPNNGGALSGRPATAFEVDICAPRAPSVPPAATLRCGLPLPAATRHVWCLGGVWVAPSAACLSAAAGQHDSTELLRPSFAFPILVHCVGLCLWCRLHTKLALFSKSARNN